MPQEPPPQQQYRDTAERLRRMVQNTTAPEIRAELLALAERYERLAARAEAKQRDLS